MCFFASNQAKRKEESEVNVKKKSIYNNVRISTEEEIAEVILSEAVRRGNLVGCDRSIVNCEDDEWAKAKEVLQRFGSVIEWNDGRGGFRFTINAEGEKFVASGGFKELRRNEALREAEVNAAVGAAESAKKSAVYAKWSCGIAGAAFALSLISLGLQTCKRQSTRTQTQECTRPCTSIQGSRTIVPGDALNGPASVLLCQSPTAKLSD